VSRPALVPTHPPIQWVPGALSLGVKRPKREADHSPPSSAEVKNAWSYTSTPPFRLHGVVFSQTAEKTLPLPLPSSLHACRWPSSREHLSASSNCATLRSAYRRPSHLLICILLRYKFQLPLQRDDPQEQPPQSES
jgi:hypothetical protein